MLNIIFSIFPKICVNYQCDTYKKHIKTEDLEIVKYLETLFDEHPKQSEVQNLVYLVYMLIDIYKSNQKWNPYNYFIFEDIYLKPNEKEMLNFLSFLQIKFDFKIINNINFIVVRRILSVLLDDMNYKIKLFDKIELGIIKKTTDNLYLFLSQIENMRLTGVDYVDSKLFNRLIGMICIYVMKNKEIRDSFVENNILCSLMKFKSINRINEWDYNETYYKLLEFLCFDPELIFYNMGNEILESFYLKGQAKFQKKIVLNDFEKKFKNSFEMKQSTFIELFSYLCEVKQNKYENYVIKLKQGINIFLTYKLIIVKNNYNSNHQGPQFFQSRKIFT